MLETSVTDIKHEDIKLHDGECYKISLGRKPLMFWNTGGHSSHVMVQSESNVPSTLPSFILEQAKRWEKEVPNMFEVLLSFLIHALTEKAEKILDDQIENPTFHEHDDFDRNEDFKDNLDINEEKKESLEEAKKKNNQVILGLEEENGYADEFESNNVDINNDAISKLELDLKEEVDDLTDLTYTTSKTKSPPQNKNQNESSTKRRGRPSMSKTTEGFSKTGKVKCEECGLMLASVECLRTHIKIIHQNIRNFRCNICRKEFSSLYSMKKHMKTSHETEKEDFSYLKKEREDKANRFCSECEVWYDTTDQLIDHVVNNHPTRPDLLPIGIRKNGPLPWSRNDVWERPEWACPLCTQEPIYKTDSGADGMVGHFRICHPDNLLCWVCGLAFNTSEGKKIYAHMRDVHPMKSIFACTECGLYNRTKILLRAHNKLHAKKGTNLLQCEECTYSTLRSDLLKLHKRIHERTEDNHQKLVCDNCGGLFKSKPSLRKHVKIFHSKTEGMHACKECNKKFFQRQSLIEHMNTHKDTKAFSCEFCAQSFVMSSSLIKHRKRKHGELIGKYPEHACPHCSKKFWQPKELKTHIDREHNNL